MALVVMGFKLNPDCGVFPSLGASPRKASSLEMDEHG